MRICDYLKDTTLFLRNVTAHVKFPIKRSTKLDSNTESGGGTGKFELWRRNNTLKEALKLTFKRSIYQPSHTFMTLSSELGTKRLGNHFY